ncbi:hypothetical protein EDO6_03057 [Paenibacillus xylanexedens]|nr:hypothetical protein EDO6_03057 [Paenibacillus xylanexedens]
MEIQKIHREQKCIPVDFMLMMCANDRDVTTNGYEIIDSASN